MDKAAAFDALVQALYSEWDGVAPLPFVTKPVKAEIRKVLTKHKITDYARDLGLGLTQPVEDEEEPSEAPESDEEGQ